MHSLCSPKDHLLDLDGIEIAVRTWGAEDGIPVLALHGWLDNAASFERLAPMLDGCFVVAPDLVGHGRSDHRRHDSGYYLWEHSQDMLAVTDSLGLAQFHVLAHGMGTGVASLLAAMTSGIASMTFLDGMGAPFTVAEDDRVQQRAPPIALGPQQLDAEGRGVDEPLLDGHRHDQCRLLVRSRPQRATHGSDGRSRARYAGSDDVVGLPASRLPDVQSAGPSYARTAGHGHPEGRLVEATQAGGDERGSAVEERPRTSLEHGRPLLSGPGQRPGGQRDRLRPDAAPAPRPDVRAHDAAGDAERVQLRAGQDAGLLGRKRLEAALLLLPEVGLLHGSTVADTVDLLPPVPRHLWSRGTTSYVVVVRATRTYDVPGVRGRCSRPATCRAPQLR